MGTIKARFRGPNGSGILELPDSATVQDIFDELRTRTGLSMFTIKYGSPMVMRSLDFSKKNEKALSCGIQGETLTLVPEEEQLSQPTHYTQRAVETSRFSGSSQDTPLRRIREDPEDINIPWPEREGLLTLRVMPSDNSCLFTAFGGALQDQITAPQLRRMMADYIREHPQQFTEAVLEAKPEQYCQKIQDPDRWGGGIELSILSTLFNIQICTYDVQASKMIAFGEDKRDRCILVYSGIHYDRVAFTFSESPYNSSSLPPEMDRTIWNTDDQQVLDKAQRLVEKLNAAHYYTDTDGLILKCDVQGCDWIGSGQAEGRKHAEQTGHVDMSEIRDTEEDNTLKACDEPGCSFMGQGGKSVRQHRSGTGHLRFSTIPDFE